MGEPAEKLGALIPSAYYDLIARVIPGITTIIGTLWGVQYPLASVKKTTDLGDGALILAALVCGYVAGFLLTTVAAPIFAGSAWLIAKCFPSVRQYSHARIWARIDKIDREKPKTGAILAKMAAEITLCANLFAGGLIVFAFSTRHMAAPWMTGILVLLVLAVVHRVVILVRRLDSLERHPLVNGPTGRCSGRPSAAADRQGVLHTLAANMRVG